jgi:ATP-dependent Lon protease
LTGRVLPIGGLKEKALAALRYGVKDVVIPFANIKDLSDIPEEFKKKLNFIPVKHIDEVLAVAFKKDSGGTKKKVAAATGSGNKRPKIAVSM